MDKYEATEQAWEKEAHSIYQKQEEQHESLLKTQHMITSALEIRDTLIAKLLDKN